MAKYTGMKLFSELGTENTCIHAYNNPKHSCPSRKVLGRDLFSFLELCNKEINFIFNLG
jgi:hypothetical protein